MTNDETRPNRTLIPDHESGVRRAMADAHGIPYHPLRSLAEAQAVSDGVVIFEGDWGGQIYATCPASLVCCSEARLNDLLRDLDAVGWCQLDGAQVFYERRPVGAGLSGGMGGGQVTPDLWVHARIDALGLYAPLRTVLSDPSPSYRSLYYELMPWDDVMVEGYVFGSIRQYGDMHGHAFVIAPDGSRAGVNWHIINPEHLIGHPNASDKYRRSAIDPEYFEECRAPDDQLWGIWDVAVPFPIPVAEGAERREMARRNLVAVLPKLRERWEAWRSTE